MITKLKIESSLNPGQMVEVGNGDRVWNTLEKRHMRIWDCRNETAVELTNNVDGKMEPYTYFACQLKACK